MQNQERFDQLVALNDYLTEAAKVGMDNAAAAAFEEDFDRPVGQDDHPSGNEDQARIDAFNERDCENKTGINAMIEKSHGKTPLSKEDLKELKSLIEERKQDLTEDYGNTFVNSFIK